MNENGCLCRGCYAIYKVDVMVSDQLWEMITDEWEREMMFCGRCIMERIEYMGAHDAYKLVRL